MKLVSFTDPYPDESLYGIASRFHKSFPSLPTSKIFDVFFGSKGVKAAGELPSRLDFLVSHLPEQSVYTTEYFIKHHTLFPYYRAFLPEDRREIILNGMRGSREQGVNVRLGLVASGINGHSHLMYCPTCFTEDSQQREAYWHRNHQLPGVFVCPTHGDYLLESEVPATALKEFIPIEQAVQSIDGRIIKLEDFYDDLHFIAKASSWLLIHGYAIDMDADELRQRYEIAMFKAGLATYSGNIRIKKSVESFRYRFPSGLLRLLDSSIDDKHPRNWVARIGQKGQTQPPIRHILMMLLLDLSPADFFSLDTSRKPFGKGPWPCLNVICQHYRNEIIERLYLGYSHKKGRLPLGTFKCPVCGYIYSRIGPDEQSTDMLQTNRIVDYGHVWGDKLISMFNQGVARSEMAHQLGVSEDAVRYQAYKLDLMQPRSPDITIPESVGQLPSPQELEAARRAWQDAVKTHPEFGMATLMGLLPDDYQLLYRYDVEWLEEHKPEADKSTGRGIQRVDWGKRDKDYRKKLKTAYRRLREVEERPQRVTVNAIAKEAGLGDGTLQRDLSKLPLCKAYLDTVTETYEDAAIRRVEWLKERCLLEGNTLSRSEFIKRADLSKAVQTIRVLEAVSQALCQIDGK